VIPEIARELGVRDILEGSVRRDENQVRITAQLIDAAKDAHLEAETYDRELTGIFQIQSEISQRIAAGGTANLTAYDLLLSTTASTGTTEGFRISFTRKVLTRGRRAGARC
jgi:hypothetical protein